MPENSREPDNTLTMEINGTKYVINEYFDGENTINDIIAKRVMSDLDQTSSNPEIP